MRNWNNAELVELNITETAYGKNPKANEANANKGKWNNGAGGSCVPAPNDPVPVIPGDDDKTPENDLSC